MVGRWAYRWACVRAWAGTNWEHVAWWTGQRWRSRSWLRGLSPITPYRPWLCQRPAEGWHAFTARIARTCPGCGAELGTPREVPSHVDECRGPEVEAAVWGEY